LRLVRELDDEVMEEADVEEQEWTDIESEADSEISEWDKIEEFWVIGHH